MPWFANQSPGWNHTHTIGAATENANGLSATGVPANVAATQTGAAGSCSVGCAAAHPNSVVAQRTDLVQASGVAKIAVVTAIPSTTGAAV